MSDGAIERELPNHSIDATAKTLMQLENDLNTLAEQTDAEYVSVRLEPLTKDQHEANESLRKLVRNRSGSGSNDE